MASNKNRSAARNTLGGNVGYTGNEIMPVSPDSAQAPTPEILAQINYAEEQVVDLHSLLDQLTARLGDVLSPGSGSDISEKDGAYLTAYGSRLAHINRSVNGAKIRLQDILSRLAESL